MVVGVDDLIIQAKFCFNIFRGFRSIWGQSLHIPIDFASHHYNSAATAKQPVKQGSANFLGPRAA